MTLNRKDFMTSLKLAMPGIESGNVTLQGSDSFVFHEGRLFTYNDSIAVLVPLDSLDMMDEGLEGAVNAKDLYNIVSKFSSDEMTLSVKDEKSWEIKCGRAKVQLTLLAFDWRARLDGVAFKDDGWIAVSDEFSKALNLCRMSGNKTKFAGVFVDGGRMVSTDGFQMNVCETGMDCPRFWITDSSASELLKIEGIDSLQLNGSWIHFKTDKGAVLSIKTLNVSEYPYEKVNDLLNNAMSIEDDMHGTLPTALSASIERANNFSLSMANQNVVRLDMDNEGVSVSSERNTGRYSENIPWEKPLDKMMEPVKVYVNADMMKAMSERSLDFHLKHIPAKNGRKLPRLVFTTPCSRHILATFLE